LLLPDLQDQTKGIVTAKILIFGTGAVGGYYGGMLVKAGFDVTFIARGENYEALKKNGLTLIGDKEKDILPINVFDSSESLGTFDYIIICTKSLHTKNACESIKKNVGEHTTIASFQNGIENEDIICEYFGVEKTIGALVFLASRLTEPGMVYQFGYNGGFVGELDKSRSQRVQDLSDMFQQSGVDIKVSEDILSAIWNKLLWNTSFNSLSVLTGKTVDKLVDEDKDMLINIMNEVKDVASAYDLKIRPDYIEFNLMRSKNLPGFKTSMLQDFEAGREIELDGLVGVVIRKAKEKNISVPNIEKIYNQIKEKIGQKLK